VQTLKKLLNPKVITSTLLSAAFLAFLLTFANSHEVWGEIVAALPVVVVPVFFLILIYLVAKVVQWKIYLARLGIRPDWQELLVPYAGGEIGNSLPMGVYLENYLLKGASGSGFGRSAAATTWMLITEIITCLLALLVIGVPGWPWVRPLAGGLLLGMVLVGMVLFKTRMLHRRLEHWHPRHRWAQSAGKGIRQFLEGGAQLFSWHTFVYGLPLTAIYLGAYATALYVIGNMLIAPGGFPWTWTDAAIAFAFSLVIVLLVPVLPHLGTVEASGLGVLLVLGVSRNLAVASFLTIRMVATGSIIVMCGLALILLHREVSQVLRQLSQKTRGRKPGKDCERPEESAGADWQCKEAEI
jgi:uncharacterized membrane protein YbhN (UPF0104 family)